MPELEHRDGEPVIVTPVSQILGDMRSEIVGGFARVETSLAGKADKGDIIRLETTQREHGDRLHSLEQDRATRQAAESANANASERQFSRRQVLWTVLVGIAGIAAVIVGPIIAAAVTGH